MKSNKFKYLTVIPAVIAGCLTSYIIIQPLMLYVAKNQLAKATMITVNAKTISIIPTSSIAHEVELSLNVTNTAFKSTLLNCLQNRTFSIVPMYPYDIATVTLQINTAKRCFTIIQNDKSDEALVRSGLFHWYITAQDMQELLLSLETNTPLHALYGTWQLTNNVTVSIEHDGICKIKHYALEQSISDIGAVWCAKVTTANTRLFVVGASSNKRIAGMPDSELFAVEIENNKPSKARLYLNGVLQAGQLKSPDLSAESQIK